MKLYNLNILKEEILKDNIQDKFFKKDKEQIAREKWQEVIGWIVNNNKKPSESSKDKLEKSLGYRIGSVKRAKNGLGSYIYYPFYEEMIFNHPDEIVRTLLDEQDLEQEAKDNWREVINWIIENNKKPSRSSKNKLEKSLGYRIANVKLAKNGKDWNTSCPFYEEMIKNHPNEIVRTLLDKQDKKARENWQEVIDWVVENNKKPSNHSSNKLEKSLGMRTSRIRRAKNGKGKSKYHPFYEEMIKNHPNEIVRTLLDKQDKKAKDNWQEVIDWVVENNKKPSQHSKDELEKSLGSKMVSIKRAKNGKGTCIYYPFYEEMIFNHPDEIVRGLLN